MRLAVTARYMPASTHLGNRPDRGNGEQRMRWTTAVAAAAVATMCVAACGNISATNEGGDRASGGNEAKVSAAFLPGAKGPAAEISGARKGGTRTTSYAAAPA